MPTFTNTSTGRSGTIQQWTVPATGSYRIEAWGAQGGSCPSYGWNGGLGARMAGDFTLTAGEVIRILVGQRGIGGTNSQNGSGHESGGGGGGSFVTRSPHNTTGSILVIAGGGGGAYYYGGTGSHGIGGTTGTSGLAGQGGLAGGTGGAAGSGSNSGFSSGFSGSDPSYGGQSYIAGGLGGLMNTTWGDWGLHGGFGGGGGCGLPSGGGGGYSGGGSGTWSNQGAGGGGGSYNSGTNQSNSSAVRSGHGLVTIELNNNPPTVPTSVTGYQDGPTGNLVLGWTHNDPDANPQAQFQVRIRVAD